MNVVLIELYRPHSRKEAKLDTKTKLYQLNELAGKAIFSSQLISIIWNHAKSRNL
jgi:hypothetical protein